MLPEGKGQALVLLPCLQGVAGLGMGLYPGLGCPESSVEQHIFSAHTGNICPRFQDHGAGRAGTGVPPLYAFRAFLNVNGRLDGVF